MLIALSVSSLISSPLFSIIIGEGSQTSAAAKGKTNGSFRFLCFSLFFPPASTLLFFWVQSKAQAEVEAKLEEAQAKHKARLVPLKYHATASSLHGMAWLASLIFVLLLYCGRRTRAKGADTLLNKLFGHYKKFIDAADTAPPRGPKAPRKSGLLPGMADLAT